MNYLLIIVIFVVILIIWNNIMNTNNYGIRSSYVPPKNKESIGAYCGNTDSSNIFPMSN